MGALALLGFGLHAWISGKPFWPGLAPSGTAFGSGALLLLIGLGREWRWWDVDGSTYDKVATVWFWATIVAAAVAAVVASVPLSP